MRTETMMISRTPSTTGFLITVDDRGIVQVTPTTRLSPELTAGILARLALASESGPHPTGLLLDVRRSPLLSLVRLSSLIEALSTLNVPLAVILADEAQQRLAILLHNTVRHRERIGYFISSDDAVLFLTRQHAQPRPRG